MMKLLRVVYLQDACVLSEMYPDNPLWNHDLLNCTTFQDFKSRVLAVCQRENDSPASRLVTLMPQVAEAINFMHRTVTDRQIETNQLFEQRFTDLNTAVQSQLVNFLPRIQNAVLTTMQNIRFNVNVNTTIDPDTPETSNIPVARDTNAVDGEVNEDVNTNATTILKYNMSRSVTTVQQLWKEWNVGFNGQRSVKDLERVFGHAWRNGSKSSETKFYKAQINYSRSAILDCVRSINTCGFGCD